MTQHASDRERPKVRAASALLELIDQFSRLLSSQSFAFGLNPTQWAALRYIAGANEEARTVGAFARHNLTTPSSASQTLGSLEQRGFIRKVPSEVDARRRVLELTSKGSRALLDDPMAKLAQHLAELSDEQLFAGAEVMELLLRNLLRRLPAEGEKP
ncbi:MAG: MarR family transcriptional regulator [Alphaproteobacteria bacterium]|nr:MarR family transcriptional regulator [Alphaproteobacteria bacterium]MCW5749569.1 MarR family transcriptional regulator [Alphaproteobacteria bacterium]